MSEHAYLVPDVLKPGLRVVFCGTAPGTVSARLRAYYAHPQNKFWRALHEVGLTPRLLRPEEFREAAQWGVGLTDLAKHVSGMDRELPPGALGRRGARRICTKRSRRRGRSSLAFTSLAAGRGYLGRAVRFGEQPERIGATRALGSALALADRRLELGEEQALVAGARRRGKRLTTFAGWGTRASASGRPPQARELYPSLAAASSEAVSLRASVMTIAPRRRSIRPSRSIALISRDTVSRRVLMRAASSD